MLWQLRPWTSICGPILHITQRNIEQLRRDGVEIIMPGSGRTGQWIEWQGENGGTRGDSASDKGVFLPFARHGGNEGDDNGRTDMRAYGSRAVHRQLPSGKMGFALAEECAGTRCRGNSCGRPCVALRPKILQSAGWTWRAQWKCVRLLRKLLPMPMWRFSPPPSPTIVPPNPPNPKSNVRMPKR